MNQIQQERLAVLEEVARRMREDDYNELLMHVKMKW